MTKKQTQTPTSSIGPYPLFKTAAEMARVSGIGENTLRKLMDDGELEYLAIGNRKLLTIQAVQDYYSRHRVPATHNS